ncbi:MAG TPA: sensor histidine kinase [Clostridium sp.]|nr:histidine kinase [Clostridium sp. Bc-iso-3]HHV30597.1 sensor histidine kinase [Clostridium sp.]
MLFGRKKGMPDIINGLEKEKVSTAWRLNLGFAVIVILSIFAVGIACFGMISNSMLSHAKVSSTELIKQTSNNIEVILTGFDEMAMTLSRDNTLAEYISMHDDIEDIQLRAENVRRIENILNNYAGERKDIANIAVVSNGGAYITSGTVRPDAHENINNIYAVKAFNESNKQSLWLNTYTLDIDSNLKNSEKVQVFSIIKGIYASSSLKSQGTLIINITEEYLYSLIADIKPSDNGKIYIIGSDGNYVLNPFERLKNGKRADLEFVEDMLGRDNNVDIEEIDGEEYLVTYNTIQHIKGTELGWIIVEITPVSEIRTSVTEAGTRLFFIGIACVVIGFILIGMATAFYNRYLNRSYSERHSIALERERLASLGQLIGGIAHNFKTPIMSIAGGLEALKDLIEEYDISIGDPQVTSEDHLEIAAEMKDWIGKIKPYCGYMSDIISTVKGQAGNMNESNNASFSVGELLKRVDILMNHELKKFSCELRLDIKVDKDTLIRGEINNLIQVLNNLISNSIESYSGNEGKIDLLIGKNDQELEIVVRDYGSGIPENVKKKLLKEMITTKGKNGTGLGLYMSHSTIKGKFGGTMKIKSEEGKGTEILISIPYIAKA